MKKLIRPMMATLITKPFNRSGWVNEEKYDGFRALAYRRGNKVRLYSRNLKDFTSDFSELAQALAQRSGGEFVNRRTKWPSTGRRHGKLFILFRFGGDVLNNGLKKIGFPAH